MSVVFGLALLLGLVTVAVLAARGWSYYTTPLIERPRHPDYWLLKPGGSWGRTYGIVGASLMTAMLVYTVRKRWRPLRSLGTLRAWLSFHIVCGVVGPLFVVLHTSFKFGGIVSLSFWSMVVVALSGVLGRYLYRQIPRRRSGDELSLEEAREAEASLSRLLIESVGLDEATVDRLDTIARAGPTPETPLPLLLVRLPFAGLSLRWRLARFGGQLKDVPRSLRRRALELARRRATLSRRILLWRRLQALFHYWHVAHKPFAAVMFLILALHIVVVSMAGYGWG